jgi:hypothetical protein
MDAAARELYQRIWTRRFPGEEVAEKVGEIHRAILEESPHIDRGNFEAIHVGDLRRMFELYDAMFLDGLCGIAARADGKELSFRLSNRMTRVGGTTSRQVVRDRRGGAPLRVSHEIAVSTTLLFQTFHDIDRPITVTGISCSDRLEALQRIFEHELVHLLEMLIWTHSSCRGERFFTLARNLFGHLETTHQLVTPRERAYAKFGIKAGDRVRFRFEGREYVGRVNRITKRATVLVEDPRGLPYSDGHRYLKFYVPVGELTPVP